MCYPNIWRNGVNRVLKIWNAELKISSLTNQRERERESQLIGIDSCSSICFESHFSQKVRNFKVETLTGGKENNICVLLMNAIMYLNLRNLI